MHSLILDVLLVQFCSKSATNSLITGLRAELHLLGVGTAELNLGIHILGLIGTDSNTNRGDTLSAKAMPTSACAAEMICAVDLRSEVAYVPQFLAPYSTLIHFAPWLAERLIVSEYLGELPLSVE